MLPVRGHLLHTVLLCLGLWLTAQAADDKVEHDRSKLSVFVQPSVSFLSFEQREYFQDAVDTIYRSFRENALTESESLNVAKQDFQKVNFCFPVTAGLQYQIFQDQFISAGIGFIYDNESVVLTDRKNRTHNYSYTIQGVPLFLEYRLGIPKNFMTLSGESLFSIAVRWYWVLPGTEIYTTWGMLEAKNPVSGSGFGISLGYLIASWKNFNIYGDIGFSSISVKSDKKFSDIVPDGPEEKAKWNIGGLQMQVRVSFGLWNEPKPVDDEDDVVVTKPKKEEGVKPAEETVIAPTSQESVDTTTEAPADTTSEPVATEQVDEDTADTVDAEKTENAESAEKAEQQTPPEE